VQSDGWYQLAVNLVSLAIVGYAAERVFGWWRWLVVYLAAGVVGQLAGYAWNPSGGGNSVAVFGLGGALLGGVLLGYAKPHPLPLLVVWFLAGEQFGFFLADWPGAVAVPVAGVIGYQIMRRWTVADRVLAAAGLAAGLGMVVLRNHHGAALLTGAVLGLVLRPPPRPDE
jgi:membrane associated rhomboid family serine protease